MCIFLEKYRSILFNSLIGVSKNDIALTLRVLVDLCRDTVNIPTTSLLTPRPGHKPRQRGNLVQLVSDKFCAMTIRKIEGSKHKLSLITPEIKVVRFPQNNAANPLDNLPSSVSTTDERRYPYAPRYANAS